MYRAALIGCGGIGDLLSRRQSPLGVQSHAAAYKRCEDTDLIAVCDVDRGRAKDCAKYWNVASAYSDVTLMLAEQQPDIVSIASGTASHPLIMKQVLGAKSVKLIICEKPLASSLEDAVELLRLSELSGKRLLVNYSRRFTPAMRDVKKLVSEGVLGDVRIVTGYYTKSLVHNGSHMLDLLAFLFGNLTLETASISRWATDEDGATDVQLRLEGGQKALLFGLNSDDFSIFELDIVGSKGRIQIKEGGNFVSIQDVQEHKEFSGYRELSREPVVIRDALVDMMLNVVKSGVRYAAGVEQEDLVCTGKDAISALRLSLQAQVSVRRCKIEQEL